MQIFRLENVSNDYLFKFKFEPLRMSWVEAINESGRYSKKIGFWVNLEMTKTFLISNSQNIIDIFSIQIWALEKHWRRIINELMKTFFIIIIIN